MKKTISILLIFSLLFNCSPLFAQMSTPLSNGLPYSFDNPSFFEKQVESQKSLSDLRVKTGSKGASVVISEEAFKNYILGAGDSISVHIIVSDNVLTIDYDFVIPPGGAIFFPNIGKIHLSGLSIISAEKRLTANIEKYYKESIRLSLILTQPKIIKVFLTGNAKKTGPFSINDGARISELIDAAGGAASGGSNRTVVIKRDNKKIYVDLYNYILNNDISNDVFVYAGDIIEIPNVSDKRVTIMGDTSRPGVYEIKRGEKLKDLLKISGFTSVNSQLSSVIFLKRLKEKEQFSEYKLNLYELYRGDDSQNVELADGDIITIPSIETFVYMYGEVAKSGRFTYLPGKKLSDYINLAGGPSARANLSYISITRNEEGKSKVFHVNASDILYRGERGNDIEIMAGDIISVPGNFFYFADFASFANTILLGLTLYTTVANYLKK